MIFDYSELFPLSQNRKIKGTRRLLREKVLQILMAYYSCEGNIGDVIKHAFFREFNFGEDIELEKDKFHRPEAIQELEADISIEWKEEDIKFAKDLVIYIINHRKELDDYIDRYASNWELERIALVDRILLQSALAEIIHFEDIPPKVSINEAIDIAKKYSTEKSKVFVNGVLDALLVSLRQEGKLIKTGKGLIDK